MADISKHIRNLGICQSVHTSAGREICDKADAGKKQILNEFGYIYVYSDKGVDGASLKQTICSLSEHGYSSKRIDAQELIHTPWENEAKLLIIPGGRDIFYHAALDGAGTDKIRSFVQNGGSYLGICAGAYFASDSIEFEMGQPLEVCGERSLKLFKGIAKGPALGNNKYCPESTRGVEAARIDLSKGQCRLYYNGGCFFHFEESDPAVQVLGRYLDLPGSPPAILNIRSGKGRVILSGVHFEYAPKYLTRANTYIDKICPILIEDESKRSALFQEILNQLYTEAT